MRIWLKFIDWLGAARRENDAVNADALRIASLEAANNEMARHLAAARNDLSRAIQCNAAWSAKCKDLQDKLDAANGHIDNLLETSGTMAVRCEGLEDRIEKLDHELQRAQPLVAYANRQKANRARYDAKRRGK